MEEVDSINQRLVDHYGIETSTALAMFRIVWANDERENRLVAETDLGIQLIHPEVRLVKKYPFFKDLYVLERLVEVPEVNLRELAGSKLSYEPIWTFCDVNRNPLPPNWDVAKLIVDVLYAALGKKPLKYIDKSDEEQEKRIIALQEELFGNETDVSDSLRYKSGVAGFHTKEN